MYVSEPSPGCYTWDTSLITSCLAVTEQGQFIALTTAPIPCFTVLRKFHD